MWYLHRAQPDEGALGLAALKGHPLLARGLVTGLIGAGVVAVWFLLLDVAGGHPLRTPAALGAALLFGASNVGAIQPNLGLVAAYTAVHVAAFAVTGALFVAVAEQIERAPAFVLLAGMAAIVLEAVAVAALPLDAGGRQPARLDLLSVHPCRHGPAVRALPDAAHAHVRGLRGSNAVRRAAPLHQAARRRGRRAG